MDKLSDRVMALEGPDRKMDGEIARKIFGAGGNGLERTVLYSKPGVSGWSHAIHYTASLDAAMTLVPEGCGWTLDVAVYGKCVVIISSGDDRIADWHGTAATPALALCAAVLKARGL